MGLKNYGVPLFLPPLTPRCGRAKSSNSKKQKNITLQQILEIQRAEGFSAKYQTEKATVARLDVKTNIIASTSEKILLFSSKF